MNKNMIIIVVAIVVVLGGGYMLLGNQQKAAPSTPATQTEESGAMEESTTGAAMEDKTATDEAMVAGTVIETKDFAYANKTYTVKAGEKVTYKNLDTVGHTVTSDDGTSFDTGLVSKDKSTTFIAPTKPGSYPFHCTPHPKMQATLIVE